MWIHFNWLIHDLTYTMKKIGVLQLALQFNFWVQWPLAIHCIFTLWVLLEKLHELQNCNSLYIRCNSLQFNCNSVKTTHFQLLCNSITTTSITSCNFHPPIKTWHMALWDFWNNFIKNLIPIVCWWFDIMTCGLIIFSFMAYY
jgi:hypothetical protein